MATDLVAPPRLGRNTPDHAVDLGESSARLRRLDLWEWFRWVSVLLIAFLLTGGIFSLSLPVLRRDWFAQAQLDINVWALFGLVLLFSAYTVYQQLVITRLRRNYAARVAMAATLEVLKPSADPADGATDRGRDGERFHLDRRVAVEGAIGGRRKVIYGRTSDISESGVGAVLPESLSLGEEVSLTIPIGPDGTDMRLTATLCHCRGFYHGFEFHHLDPAELAAVRKACDAGVPLRWFRR